MKAAPVPANDNLPAALTRPQAAISGNDLGRSAAHLFSNMLRVARGAGKPNAILRDAEDLVEALRVVGQSEDPIPHIVEALRCWQEYVDSVPDGKLQVILGAMQLVASASIGQGTQVASGEAQMYGGIRLLSSKHIEAQRIDIAKIVRQGQADDIARRALRCVYFISDGLAVKIGVSVDPIGRMATLQTSHHAPLSLLATIPGGYDLEAELHREFASDRLRTGGEWFTFSDKLRAKVAEYSNDDLEAA